MPKPNPSPFLTLPPDLRLKIYTYILVSRIPIKGPSARQSTTYDIHTAILRVNKQIHSEARHVFFGLNTFHITSSPGGDGEGEGAFEPPLQLKDLGLVRRLVVDLVYWPRAGRKEGEEWVQRRGAERYVTSLAFVLSAAKQSLTSLQLLGDARPYTTPSPSPQNEESPNPLDLKSFLTPFRAASHSRHFQSALAALKIENVGVRFEFAEMWFDFCVRRDALEEWSLEWLAAQVLVKRCEVGIWGVVEELGGMGEEGEGGEEMGFRGMDEGDM